MPFRSKCRVHACQDMTLAVILFCIGRLAFPPTIAYAAGSEGWGIWGTLGRIFNVLVVVVVLVYALRRPLSDFFDRRRKEIQREIEAAKLACREAEGKLAEMEKRMTGLDAELKELQEKAMQEAEEERNRILTQAEKEAGALIEGACREAEALLRAGRMELREYTAQLAVELAAEKICSSMDSATQQRLVENFSRQLNKLS